MASSTLLNAAIMGDINAINSLINNYTAHELLILRIPYSGNTILHLASESGSILAVETILSKQSLLLPEFNSQGNTALHLSARGGHVNIVSALIECAKRLDVRRFWFRLPESSYNQQIDEKYRRKLLIGENKRIIQDTKNGKLEPWRALLQWKNMKTYTALHEGTRYNRIQVVTVLLDPNSAFNYTRFPSEKLLYMAASRGFDVLVDAIIKASPQPSYSYAGLDGRTALHAAVICNSKNCTTILLTWKKSLAAEKDGKSQTALHYAAQLGFVDIVRELINVDSSTAYITNMECKNVLHLAVEHKQKDVIEYLLEECPSLVNNLLIMEDDKGNTPLHVLAACNCFVPKLIHHPMADIGALNYRCRTPLELAIYDNNRGLSMIETKSEIAEELRRAGAMVYLKDNRASIDIDKVRAERLVQMQRMVDNHMIVATLIATVAFTAGFAMPGGYNQNGSPNQGMAVLAKISIAFQAFVISDAIALLFSSSALFLYFFSSLSLIYEQQGAKIFDLVLIGMQLNIIGLGAIIVAFISGTYAVLQYSHTLAIATSIIASSIFLIHCITDLRYDDYEKPEYC